MEELDKLNSAELYPPLSLPAVSPEQLNRGARVQTRYFYANSLPGNKSKVIRFWQTSNGGWLVRVNCGNNAGGQSILKTMCISALALDQD